MTFPSPPNKIVPFNSGPVAPYDIGRQFDEHSKSISDIIDFLKTVIRDDGRLRELANLEMRLMPRPRDGLPGEPGGPLPPGVGPPTGAQSPPLEGEMVLGPNAGGFFAADVDGATATSAD